MFIRLFVAVHHWLLRVSKGRIGSQLGPQSMLVLHHTGRRSGKAYAVPIAYYYQDGRYLIVASNWGKDHHADWYLNLLENPSATLDVKGQSIAVTAHELQGEEYERLWQELSTRHKPYANYQAGTERRIPIMSFSPDA